MLRKIKNSLSAKVFLWVAGLLILCSFVIHGIIMLALPQSYEFVANSRIEDEANQLAATLHTLDYETGTKEIEKFCISNDTYALLTTDGVFTDFGQQSSASATITIHLDITFTDSAKISFLTIVANTSARAEITTAFLKLLPFVLVFILVISFISAFLCSRVLVKPVLEISDISKRMSELDMTWNCNVNRTDELGVLASSLNSMSERLSRTMKELEDANERLTEDILATQKLEKQRRDFFAAVSHELKTPITIIKGQLESMILSIGDYKNYEKYLPQVLVATENMEYLVREILSISKMEAMGFGDNMSEISIMDIISECVQTGKPLAEEKQISIHLEVERDVKIYAHPELIKKAFSNIIGNAIQHSLAGSEIGITLISKKLKVENNGVTILPEDLPYLFTPFYRADKSRSRATGGSGLGLYIVKTILELHHLNYQIKNESNSVIFTVELNQN